MKGKHEMRRMKAELQAAQSALAVEKDRNVSLLRIIQSMSNEIESLRDVRFAPTREQLLADATLHLTDAAAREASDE